MPACRTVKPISLWDMSSVQTPGVIPEGRVISASPKWVETGHSDQNPQCVTPQFLSR
jgi:hypothetical protein